MGKHIVRVVDDNTLATDEGWAMALTEDGELYFIVERSAAVDEQVLTDAWDVARKLEDDNAAMQAAVADGHRRGPHGIPS